jgi:hypothetical protein
LADSRSWAIPSANGVNQTYSLEPKQVRFFPRHFFELLSQAHLPAILCSSFDE